jgi:hypothetical protein
VRGPFRRFRLVRQVDVSSVSGTGPVVEGFRPKSMSVVMEALAWPSWPAAAREDGLAWSMRMATV